MSRLRSPRGRGAGIAILVCIAALALTGCVTFRNLGSGVERMTIWVRPSAAIFQDYENACARGDRGGCVILHIRANFCNNMSGSDKLYCYDATDPSDERSEVVSALNSLRYGQCLEAAGGGGYWNWFVGNDGVGDCRY
jgi:hypothetical protein